MPWLLNEDGALKLKLQGLRVFDANSPVSGRPVPVRFRLPESEVADLTFPIVIITHQGWYPAPERMHDGFTTLPYAPEGFAPWWKDTGPDTTTFDPLAGPYYSYFPIPYNFDYQVTVYSRFMHEHTIPLVSALAQYERLHPKYGFLDIPQDGTKRTMQLIGGPDLRSGTDNNGKRIFWVDYKVRVFSELLPTIYTYPPVKEINVDLSEYSSTTDITANHLIESKSLLSVGVPIEWSVAQLNFEE